MGSTTQVRARSIDTTPSCAQKPQFCHDDADVTVVPTPSEADASSNTFLASNDSNFSHYKPRCKNLLRRQKRSFYNKKPVSRALAVKMDSLKGIRGSREGKKYNKKEESTRSGFKFRENTDSTSSVEDAGAGEGKRIQDETTRNSHILHRLRRVKK